LSPPEKDDAPPSPATALPQQLHGLLPYLLVFFLTYRGIGSPVRKKQEMYFFIYGTTFKENGSSFSDLAIPDLERSLTQTKKRNYGNHLLAIIIGSLSHHPSNVE
jgi:hypothetical protein